MISPDLTYIRFEFKGYGTTQWRAQWLKIQGGSEFFKPHKSVCKTPL